MTRTTAQGGSGTTALVVLIRVAWVLGPLVLAGAAIASVTFLGELPTPAAEAHADCLFIAAALTAIAVPVVGLLVSWWKRRTTSAAAFAVALSLGLLAAVPVLDAVADDRTPSAIPSSGGGSCQEHSGGDARCPGG